MLADWGADVIKIEMPAGDERRPINDIGRAFEEEQAKHLGMAKPAPHPELGELSLIRSPINLRKV